MKRDQLLVSGLLIASLSLPFAQQAWSADRAKVAATRKRVAKKVMPAPRPASPKLTASTPIADAASEGLRLSLTTQLREPPATPVVRTTALEQPAVAAVASAAASVSPSPVIPVVVAPSYTPPLYIPPVYTPRPVPTIGARADNPYLPREASAERAVEPVGAASQAGSGGFFSGLMPSIPLLPGSGQSILPKITKVYPTGEKPLVVVSFKCPTEVVGITPPTIKILHEAVSLGMTGINKTDLLSFDLQQVCQ